MREETTDRDEEGLTSQEGTSMPEETQEPEAAADIPEVTSEDQIEIQDLVNEYTNEIVRLQRTVIELRALLSAKKRQIEELSKNQKPAPRARPVPNRADKRRTPRR